jgi:methionine synthase I (cobalamin-dependent)
LILERPRAVGKVHAAYAAAGAGWLQTNTFGANGPRLELFGLSERVAEVNAAAVAVAREAAGELPVLASIGPTGASDRAAWESAYAAQAEALAGCDVDGFIVETIVRLGEGLAAVRAAAAVGMGPVIASFTPGADGRLLDGAEAEAAAVLLFEAGAAAVGVNCGEGPESLLGPVRRLVRAGLGPVFAAPNAGLPSIEVVAPLPMTDDRCQMSNEGAAAPRFTYALGAEAFARAAMTFLEEGVRLFAGCCGTTPAHIAAASALLSSGLRKE